MNIRLTRNYYVANITVSDQHWASVGLRQSSSHPERHHLLDMITCGYSPRTSDYRRWLLLSMNEITVHCTKTDCACINIVINVNEIKWWRQLYNQKVRFMLFVNLKLFKIMSITQNLHGGYGIQNQCQKRMGGIGVVWFCRMPQMLGV